MWCDMFQACIKVFGTTHKLTEVTDFNGYIGGIHLWSDAETKPCRHLQLYYANGTEVNHTCQCHAPAKFISFSIPCVAFCSIMVTSWKITVIQLQLWKENYKFTLGLLHYRTVTNYPPSPTPVSGHAGSLFTKQWWGPCQCYTHQ